MLGRCCVDTAANSSPASNVHSLLNNGKPAGDSQNARGSNNAEPASSCYKSQLVSATAAAADCHDQVWKSKNKCYTD